MRWDPHLHTPGTLRNNQFGNDWDAYLTVLLKADPAPAALGITDYFTLRGYKNFLRHIQGTSIASGPLIFPNIELRLTIETQRGKAINFHLLVSPDDSDHVSLMEEKLGRLSFNYQGQPYYCTDESLTRLGRAVGGSVAQADEAALREGANQFKIDSPEKRSSRPTPPGTLAA